MSDNEEKFVAYVTKYALTRGILRIEAVKYSEHFIYDVSTRYGIGYHGEGREWHRTHADAVNRAEEMRRKKIRSMEAKIAQLKSMNFKEG